MAHSVSITDGTTTVSLSTSNVLLTQYVPSTPEIAVTRRTTLGDGAPVDMPRYENVTETIDIMLENSSKTSLQAQVTSINRLLLTAHRRQLTKAGARVYLQLQVDGESDTWRSEIYTGRLELGQDALRHYSNIKVQAALVIERAYFWEGSQAEVSISISTGGAGTGGKTIYNHDDSGTGHDNWVQMAAAQITGDLPTPALITLTNNTGSAQPHRNIYIATNAYSDPANFTHIVEGESAASGGSTVSNANSSNGNLRRFSSVTSTTAYWTITGSQLQKMAGRHFRLLLRCPSVTSTVYVKPEIRDATGLTSLYIGDEVAVTSEVSIVDLGTLPFPPSTASASWDDVALYLAMRGSGATFDIDFIQLTPLDSFAHIYQLGLSNSNSDVITIDGVEGSLHVAGHAIFTAAQPTVWLFPNKLQRLIFLHDESTGAPDIANTFSVRVYYRPRRLTI